MDYKSWGSQRMETTVPTTLDCLCGYPVACQVVGEGECLGSLVFFDEEEASSTYGEQVELAPSVV
jgi:hypothetical protein